MSAIRLVNSVPASDASLAEFRVLHGRNEIARIGIACGGEASVPTTVSVGTAQSWTAYAIINGITTETVTITDPNATVTVSPDNNDDGYVMTIS